MANTVDGASAREGTVARGAARRATLREELLAVTRALLKVTARFDDDVEKVAQVAAVIERIVDDRLAAERPEEARQARRSPTAEGHVLRAEARDGATSLAIEWNGDGSAEVRINGGASFRLQPKPALLLNLIAAPGGRPAGDSLVGWRSYPEIAAAFSKSGLRVASRHNVIHTIYRLRAAMRRAGQNWFLIQTDRHGAVRFALRRDAADVLAVHQHRAGSMAS